MDYKSREAPRPHFLPSLSGPLPPSPLPWGRRLWLEPGGQRPGRISGRKYCGARGGSGDLGEFPKVGKVNVSHARAGAAVSVRLGVAVRAGVGGVTAPVAVRAARAWRAVASSLLGPPTTVPRRCLRLWPAGADSRSPPPSLRGALLSAPLYPFCGCAQSRGLQGSPHVLLGTAPRGSGYCNWIGSKSIFQKMTSLRSLHPGLAEQRLRSLA